MSIPADTPAAVMIVPCSTTRRSPIGIAPCSRTVSSARQWVVASLPSRIPAAASSSDPVHTDVVHSAWAWACRSQPRNVSLVMSARVPYPPGTTITSGSGSSSRVRSATSASIFVSVRFGPVVSAMK